MRLLLLVLSIVGALLSITGWAVERALKFAWLRRRLSRRVDTGIQALDALRADPKLGFTHDDQAFKALSAVWPRFPHSLSVYAIGRTVAYVEFGTEIKNEIGLTLFDEKLQRIEGYDWTITAATAALIAPFERRFRVIGTLIFFLGIVVSIVVAIIRFAL